MGAAHIDDDQSAYTWNSLCGRIKDSNGTHPDWTIECADDYCYLVEHDNLSWCPECENHPRLPLLIIAKTDL